jgi:hypothetical protein
MATTKRLSGNYTVATPTNGTITLDTGSLAGTVVVTGNLVVQGVQTVVESTTTQVVDPTITLNQGESGTGVTAGYAGIEVDRGLGTDVQLRWNEAFLKWQVSDQTGAFANIAASTGTFLLQVADDTTPSLGGNLDIQNYQIYNSQGAVVQFNNNLAIATTSVAPTAIANNVVVYSSTVSGGGSGLYTSTASGNNELATKSAAIKYSIIFG